MLPRRSIRGVEFDGGFSSAEFRPRGEIEAKIDGGGIEGVDGLLQIDGEAGVSIEFAGVSDENVCKVGIDSPVAFLVGLGQGVACDGAAKAQVVKLGFDGVQTGFDVAETVSSGELRKGHAEELIVARELPDAIIPLVNANAAVEIAFGQGVHELREEILPGVHRPALSAVFRGKGYGIRATKLKSILPPTIRKAITFKRLQMAD